MRRTGEPWAGLDVRCRRSVGCGSVVVVDKGGLAIATLMGRLRGEVETGLAVKGTRDADNERRRTDRWMDHGWRRSRLRGQRYHFPLALITKASEGKATHNTLAAWRQRMLACSPA